MEKRPPPKRRSRPRFKRGDAPLSQVVRVDQLENAVRLLALASPERDRIAAELNALRLAWANEGLPAGTFSLWQSLIDGPAVPPRSFEGAPERPLPQPVAGRRRPGP